MDKLLETLDAAGVDVMKIDPVEDDMSLDDIDIIDDDFLFIDIFGRCRLYSGKPGSDHDNRKYDEDRKKFNNNNQSPSPGPGG